MAVIMASNEKGGVGKSSVLMGLAAVFAARGKGVCVVELDRQGSISGWLSGPDGVRLSVEARKSGATVSAALSDPASALGYVLPTKEGFFVLPADRKLSRAGGKELRALVGELEGSFDYVMLDLRRDVEESLESVEGLAAKAIVPMLADAETLTGVKKVVDDLDGKCDFRLVFNRIRANSVRDWLCRESVKRDVPTVPVFESCVHDSCKVGEATYDGMTVVGYDKRNRASRDLAALADEVEAWCAGTGAA